MKTKPARFLLAAAVVIAAALLPAYFFQYRFERYHCEIDVCDLPDPPLWVGSQVHFFAKPVVSRNPITHKIIVMDGKPLMGRPLIEGVVGVFPRQGVPIAVALTGGILIPLLLLGYATVLLFRRST